MRRLYIVGSFISKFSHQSTRRRRFRSHNRLSISQISQISRRIPSYTRWFHSLHLPLPSLWLCWPLPPMQPQPLLPKETPLRCFSLLSIKPYNLVPKISAGGAHQATTLAVWPHQSLFQQAPLPPAIATKADRKSVV